MSFTHSPTLRPAERELEYGQQRWLATGADVGGDEMTCVAVIEDGVVVVTMF